jgi:hypothetical protein
MMPQAGMVLQADSSDKREQKMINRSSAVSNRDAMESHSYAVVAPPTLNDIEDIGYRA